MITSVTAWLRWFDGVNRRAIRDIGGLPEESLGWSPSGGTGEDAWSVRELIGHMVVSRRFFVGALTDGTWTMASNDQGQTGVASCVELLQRSGEELAAALTAAGDGVLTRKIPTFEDPEIAVSGWRLLMMVAEHDIHHRSQIMTYAGLNGWPVAQVFGRSYEDVVRLTTDGAAAT